MYAYVGSFTTAKRKARGDGIHVYRSDAATGVWTHVQHIGELTNPSFLALSPDQRFLYSVHGDSDYASAFALDRQTGQARLLNHATTGGNNGVRQAVDPSGRYLLVANYASGTVAVLPILPDGSLADQHQLLPLPGEPGPHRTQQPSSEPHDVVFDPSGHFVLVPDKGLDRIFVFRFDASTGRLTPAEPDSVKSRPGAGPRHLAFHPRLPIVWVLNELDSTTTTYRWDGQRGTLLPIQVITTLPTDFTGYSTTAEIAVTADGRTVLLLQSRSRQRCNLCHGGNDRTAAADRLAIDAGRRSAFRGARPERSFPARCQRERRHHRHIRGGGPIGQAHSDRPGRQKRQPRNDRLHRTTMSNRPFLAAANGTSFSSAARPFRA